MKLDLSIFPYSRRGSYLCVMPIEARDDRPGGLYLRSVHGYARPPELLLIEPVKNGQVLAYTLKGGFPVIRMESAEGWAELCLGARDLLRFRGEGIGLKFSRQQNSWGECAMPAPGGRCELNCHLQRMKAMFHPLRGTMTPDYKYVNPGLEYFRVEYSPNVAGFMEGAIEEFHRGWYERTVDSDFDADAAALKAEFEDWLASAPEVMEPYRDTYTATRMQAAYLNWSCLVAPAGYLTREGMFMSKHVMTGIWSWDNCFNAMATALMQMPDLAWDQLALFFDQQNEDGCLQDTLTDNISLCAFNKPPIQGWVLRELEKIPGFMTEERVAECYEPLVRWANWWFDTRDYDGDGVPQYNHGNDSGWDNATCFDHGLPVEAPDLSAFLVVLDDLLADYAIRLGHDEEARRWSARAQQTLDRLIEHSWTGKGFVSPRDGDHSLAEGDSLLNLIPIVLGRRLPEAVRGRMIEILSDEGRFLAPSGFATESLRSDLYEEAGYWRGPVWAPSTMILLSGLRDCGEEDLVNKVAARFCEACRKSGFAENFDALTGASRNDSCYTWTSSVFLILANGYLEAKD